MKLWQKIFVWLLVIFLIGFDMAAFLIVRNSYQNRANSELKSAFNEAYVIQKSITDRLSNVAINYVNLNAQNIKQYVVPYAEYYSQQNTYLMIFNQNELIFSNFPPASNQTSQSLNNGFQEIEGQLYAVFKNKIELNFSGEKNSTSLRDFELIYIKSEVDLQTQQREIINFTLTVSVVISVAMTLIVIIILLKFTQPIKKLTQASQEIAGGNYQQRIKIKQKDEIGELARNFNQMAASIEKQIHDLQQLTLAKQHFIDDLAHEMRTPMTAIVGYSELLKNSSLSKNEQLRVLNYLVNQSHYLQNLAQRLMTLTQLKHDQLHLKSTDLLPLLRHLKQTLDITYPQQIIDWQIDLAVAKFRVDPDLFASLLQNILENSYRHLPESGLIIIRTFADQQHIYLEIEDNGEGIPATELDKVANSFYRVDKARSKKNGGLGLGLTICQEICQLHQIQMAIDSVVGRGTLVTLIFTKSLQNDDESMVKIN